jgi:hypothetical protein
MLITHEREKTINAIVAERWGWWSTTVLLVQFMAK